MTLAPHETGYRGDEPHGPECPQCGATPGPDCPTGCTADYTDDDRGPSRAEREAARINASARYADRSWDVV